jgi:hypothetical protein
MSQDPRIRWDCMRWQGTVLSAMRHLRHDLRQLGTRPAGLGVKWSQVQILSARRRSEAILAHWTAGLNDRPTLAHVSCAGQTVCWRADTPPALVVTTAATALAQPTVTRALKTLNRGGIVVGDRHIDGEQIVFVELTATARGAEECLPTAAGSAFPG